MKFFTIKVIFKREIYIAVTLFLKTKRKNSHREKREKCLGLGMLLKITSKKQKKMKTKRKIILTIRNGSRQKIGEKQAHLCAPHDLTL